MGARRALGAFLIVMGVLAGCGLSPATKHQSSDALAPIEAPFAGVDRSPVTTHPGQTAAGWIDDCVRYVQHGAFIGDVPLRNLWTAAGQDVASIRTICAGLRGPDLAELRDLPAADLGARAVPCDTCQETNQY